MTKLVGILNITPDSFSDGGLYIKNTDILAQCKKLLDDGADMVDVGAESTRPNASPITAEEEWNRLAPSLPEIVALAHHAGRLVSVDTYHPQTARRAMDAGVDWINDVSGLINPEMTAFATITRTPFVIMHHLGIPARTDITLPPDQNPTLALNQWIIETIARLEQKGIHSSQLLFDPGIGFGKTHAQSMYILQHIDMLCVPPASLYVGHSRKSFLSTACPHIPDRDEATLEISKSLVHKKVAFLRVHDIATHRSLINSLTTHQPPPGI